MPEVPTVEDDIRSRTEQDDLDACQLWLDGINLLIDALKPLDGISLQDKHRDHVLLPVLMHAAQTQQAAYLLAVSGYCVQALPLTRLGYEDWVTFWYMKNWPEEAPLLLKFASQKGEIEVPSRKPGGTPTKRVKALKVQDMLDRMETKVGQQDPRARAWKDSVNALAHVGFGSIRRAFESDGQATNMHVGPRYDKKRFYECVVEFATEIPPLLNAAVVCCRLLGVPALSDETWKAYAVRVVDWGKNVATPLVAH